MEDSKASFTAYVVCQGILGLSKDKTAANLVSPEAAKYSQYFVEEARKVSAIHKMIAMLPHSVQGVILNKVMLDGVRLHYGMRKLAIEQAVRRSFKAQYVHPAAKQVIIVGGGFDSLALRLHKEFPNIEFFEIDHPATQAVKLKALENHHATWGENLHFVACDLGRTPLAEALMQHPAYSKDKVSVSVAEGVLPYLQEKEVRSLFEGMKQCTPAESTVIFGCLGNAKFSGSAGTVAQTLQSAKKEKYDFTMRSEEVPQYMKGLGYKTTAYAPYLGFQKIIRDESLTSLREAADKAESYFAVRNASPAELAQSPPDIASLPSLPVVIPKPIGHKK